MCMYIHFNLSFISTLNQTWMNIQDLLSFAKCIWGKVLRSDETKVKHFGHNSKSYVWCNNIKHITRRTWWPHWGLGGGGSIMLWGCVSSAGAETWVQVVGILNRSRQCWHKTLRFLLESWGWRVISMTQSIQPSQ